MKNIETLNSSLGKNIFLFYLALLIWMPLPLGSNRVWFWSISEIWIFFIAAFLCVAYLKKGVSSNRVINNSWPILWVFFTWLVLLLFQLLPLPIVLIEFFSPTRLVSQSIINDVGWFPLTENVQITSSYFFKSLSYVLLFIITLILVNSRRRVKILAWTIVCSALFQAMYGSLMTLSGLEYGFFVKKIAYLDVATGTFVNRNHLAGYLNMGLALGVGLLVAGLDRGSSLRTVRQWSRKILQLLLSHKVQLRVFIAIMTIALVLTHSRMGNTVFFIALTTSVLLVLLLTQHARKTMAVLVISIVLIDIFIMSAWFGLEKLAVRMQQTSLQTEQRDEVAVYTYEQWQDYFVIGSGGGTFKYVFPKYRGPEISLYYDHTHNDLLEIASETGLLGISLLIFSVVLSFITTIKALSLRRDPLMIGMALSSMMTMIALSIHSFVDFNLQIPANASTFVVILALAWIARFHKKQAKNN